MDHSSLACHPFPLQDTIRAEHDHGRVKSRNVQCLRHKNWSIFPGSLCTERGACSHCRCVPRWLNWLCGSLHGCRNGTRFNYRGAFGRGSFCGGAGLPARGCSCEFASGESSHGDCAARLEPGTATGGKRPCFGRGHRTPVFSRENL